MSYLDLYSPPVRSPKILDFDIENRPLSYLGNDFTTSEITAIAYGFTVDDIKCDLLGLIDTPVMLERFRAAFDEADIVTGHYILMHDLPIINGAMLENGLRPLGPKLVSDTKVHLLGGKGVSKSQESLAEMMGCEAPKIQMTQGKWRDANRLTLEGLAHTRERVVGDVRQHMELREKLIAGGYLRQPKLWAGGW